MIIVNLWMLKARNGMYWYALDYVARLGNDFVFVVRKAKGDAIAQELRAAGHTVRELDLFGFLRFAATAIRGRMLIYTPTPHPIPFARRQLVVVHDQYPFAGQLGRLKKTLFWFGVRMSGCTVGYISRSVCLPFLRSIWLGQCKTLFAPNIPPKSLAAKREANNGPFLKCVAVGTDSRKKRYEVLLGHGLPNNIRLFIYGEANDYTEELKDRFGKDCFTLVNPGLEGFANFIASADLIVSVADGEGFGRPLALAIAMGVPCHLLESPAFHEFFGGRASLYRTVNELLTGMLAPATPKSPTSDAGFLGRDYQTSIDTAVTAIKSMSRPEEVAR